MLPYPENLEGFIDVTSFLKYLDHVHDNCLLPHGVMSLYQIVLNLKKGQEVSDCRQVLTKLKL